MHLCMQLHIIVMYMFVEPILIYIPPFTRLSSIHTHTICCSYIHVHVQCMPHIRSMVYKRSIVCVLYDMLMLVGAIHICVYISSSSHPISQISFFIYRPVHRLAVASSVPVAAILPRGCCCHCCCFCSRWDASFAVGRIPWNDNERNVLDTLRIVRLMSGNFLF